MCCSFIAGIEQEIGISLKTNIVLFTFQKLLQSKGKTEQAMLTKTVIKKRTLIEKKATQMPYIMRKVPKH